MNPKIFVLIPTHNRAHLLNMCLEAMDVQSFKNFEVVVVDDGSTDETAKVLKSFQKKFRSPMQARSAASSRMTILEGDGNLWWTGAMRKGIDYILSQASDEDLVVLMNDDTAFGPDYLANLVKLSKDFPEQIITSVCFEHNNPDIIHEAGVVLDWSKPRYDKPLKLPKDYQNKKYRQVDTACGRGTLAPVTVFRDVGNFSQHLPHYHSDYEFMIRAKRSGYPIIISYTNPVYATQAAGGIKFNAVKKNWSELYKELFSIRSKNNLKDQVVFTCLAVPNKYKPLRFWYIFKDLAFRISLTPPFYGLRQLIGKSV